MDESADIKAFKNGYAPPKIKDLPIKLKVHFDNNNSSSKITDQLTCRYIKLK